MKLSEINGLNCILITSKQIIVTSADGAKKSAKEIFDVLKCKFEIRGGGNIKICKGSSNELENIKEYVLSLK